MSQALAFSKYEGLGNDFIVVERDGLPDRFRTPQALGALCDRHRGIGADGVLVVSDSPLRMSIVNADGSAAEMCGNGLRCAALHWLRKGRVQLGSAFVVETDAGPHRCCVLEGRPTGAEIEVEMVPPVLDAAALPVDVEAWPQAAGLARWLEVPLELGEQVLRLSAVSMGNPHVVSFDALSEAQRKELGPKVEVHPAFIEGVNVGFAELGPGNALTLRVWERGAGWTLACGTGACAAAVAATLSERLPADTWLPVVLPGGTLEICVAQQASKVTMRGPARFVFTGQVGG